MVGRSDRTMKGVCPPTRPRTCPHERTFAVGRTPTDGSGRPASNPQPRDLRKLPAAAVVERQPLEGIVREVVVKYLEHEGFRSLQAGDGDTARELIERESPSLVVLDVMMPGTDGLALCRWTTV